jgi:pSer/pThr/pTyr-binding forkhead associated (FHA) protein
MSNEAAGQRGAPKVAVIRYSAGELSLRPGSYVIGRAPTNDIVLSTPLVSRQHARLIVGPDSVTIEDLGSANGVGLNGKRVRVPCTVLPGDKIGIGGQELELCTFGSAPELVRTLLEEDRVSKVHTQALDMPATTTHRGDGLELVGSMADRALAGHRPHDAANILRPRLTALLEDAKRGKTIPLSRREAAIEYACRLAVATHDGKWVEYVLELLIHLGMPCPELQNDLLRQAVEGVTSFDAGLLERYAAALRALPQNIQRVRAVQHANILIRASQNKS